MSVAAQRVESPVTWEQFVALPEDDRRELIDGELVETEMPTRGHEEIVAMLIGFLFTWARSNGARLTASGYKVKVSRNRGVMPDVQLYRRDNPARTGHDQAMANGRPDLAVEVISPGSQRYDRVKKLDYYRSLGVPEYWIVDRDSRTLQRFLLVDANYQIDSSGYSEDDVFKPATFEGFELPLAELWNVPGEPSAEQA